MSFSAKDVKALRDKTGAGMMDCKKALTENSGDMEAAVDWLRTKGLAQAAKKQGRVAAEGVVVTAIEGNAGVLLEVNCETDFVSKGDDFQGFANTIAALILKNNPSDVEAVKNMNTESGISVMETIQELTMKLGEKIDIRRFQYVALENSGRIDSYVHGGKIGAVVKVETASDVNGNDDFQEFMKDVCMHVTAADPKFVKADEIDEDYKNREAAIYETQLKEQGKPENMIPNIIKGKLNKLASEVCLLEQKFIKNPDITVKKLAEEVSKKIGSEITVSSFYKYNLGEGIEKKDDNLADEVAKMTGGN